MRHPEEGGVEIPRKDLGEGEVKHKEEADMNSEKEDGGDERREGEVEDKKVGKIEDTNGGDETGDMKDKVEETA